ncbi:hypothetical protein ACQCN2_09115 [Brevibacillus ginsengisoli]|uniref:hypothetical protein n=1 Tax=Brevibacillus ginsengisoli TaxID=363854 RepID=UPI003CEADC17
METINSPGSVQEQLRECILFGILFKAAMADLNVIHQLPLRLSYHHLLENLSRWAEKQHLRLKRSLRQNGCELLTSRKENHLYCVKVNDHGYQRESFYSIELLKAECQQRVRTWILASNEKSYLD